VEATRGDTKVTIGQLAWDDVARLARGLAGQGGAAVPEGAASLTDLAVTGPAEILAVSRARNAGGHGDGGVVMSSGGTTGRPKLTYVAYHQATGRLLAEWRPLRPEDTLLNLFTPGRMWASHYYMQALAEASKCNVVPAGPYEPDEIADWLTLFKEIGVNAAAGTPTALADFAQGVLDSGATMPLEKLIWMAEPWTEAKESVVRTAFPGVEFWGNYGSVETYVMATNTPACDATTLHLMPDQVMEPDDEGALLTRVGTGWTVPTVRYRLGDRVAPATCRCGRGDGLRVLGRADDSVKLHGALVGIGELLQLVTRQPGVTEAQLELTRSPGAGHSVRRIGVHFTGEAEPDAVRTRVLREFYDLGVIAQHSPEAITAVRVEQVRRVDRTNKIPPMIWRDIAPEEPAEPVDPTVESV
jgi:phenylacetate-CoA ligase